MASKPRRPDNPNPIPSSSPAFGTPAHPILPRRTAPIKAPPLLKPAAKSTVLPILLPPATLRPLAFRTFTKKHDLTLTSSALGALATFIGRQCGSGWREEGLAEKVLEEVAKSWKKCGGQVIVDAEGDILKNILKTLEGSMHGGRITPGSGLSRQGSFHFGSEATGNTTEDGASGQRPSLDHAASFGISSLDVNDKEEDEEDILKDPREWIKLISAFEQPKLLYNPTQKHFEKSSTKPTLLPPPSEKTTAFRQRYHILHQRILRNETFTPPSFSNTHSRHATASSSTPVTITPIANLLGRHNTTHLLLGQLTLSPTSTLTLSDLTGSIALDLTHALPVPQNSAFFTPGMIVLVDGTYEEDYGHGASGSNTGALGNTGGIGGTIGGKFLCFSIGHPPCEKRSVTLGPLTKSGTSSQNQNDSLTGPAAFGWTDFLGVGSARATGARMTRLAAKLMPPTESHKIVICSDVHLDQPQSLSSLRTLLNTYSKDTIHPLAILLIGPFHSNATLSGLQTADSLSYKTGFDALATLLSEFQALVAHTSLVFVPGDNDAWASAFSGGAATSLPRKPVPGMFTTRIRRVVAEANREIWGMGGGSVESGLGGAAEGKKGGKGGKGKRKEGEVIWTSNPTRLSWFGVKGEMVILRDDMLSRMRRNGVKFGKPEDEEDEGEDGDQNKEPSEEEMDALMADVGDGGTEDTQMDIDPRPQQGTASFRGDRGPSKASGIPPSIQTARSLTATILSQSHLSPFPLSLRPIHWSYAHTLSLYPLPSSLILADSEAPPFVVKYNGCTVMNPGALDASRGDNGGRRMEGRARWVEWDLREEVGLLRVEG